MLLVEVPLHIPSWQWLWYWSLSEREAGIEVTGLIFGEMAVPLHMTRLRAQALRHFTAGCDKS